MARAAPTRQACKRGKVPARFPTQVLTWSGYEGMISAGRAIQPQPSTPSVLFGVSVMACEICFCTPDGAGTSRSSADYVCWAHQWYTPPDSRCYYGPLPGLMISMTVSHLSRSDSRPDMAAGHMGEVARLPERSWEVHAGDSSARVAAERTLGLPEHMEVPAALQRGAAASARAVLTAIRRAHTTAPPDVAGGPPLLGQSPAARARYCKKVLAINRGAGLKKSPRAASSINIRCAISPGTLVYGDTSVCEECQSTRLGGERLVDAREMAGRHRQRGHLETSGTRRLCCLLRRRRPGAASAQSDLASVLLTTPSQTVELAERLRLPLLHHAGLAETRDSENCRLDNPR